MKYLVFLQYKRRLKKHYSLFFFNWFLYHSIFFGSLIFWGKKLKAFNFFLKIKSSLKLHEKRNPYWIFLIAMLKITPKIFLRILKLGANTKGVPLPIRNFKSFTFAVKWLLKSIKDKFGNITLSTLVSAIVQSFYGKGNAFLKKKHFHKIGMENRFLIKRFFR